MCKKKKKKNGLVNFRMTGYFKMVFYDKENESSKTTFYRKVKGGEGEKYNVL